jgi:hypothetical protein
VPDASGLKKVSSTNGTLGLPVDGFGFFFISAAISASALYCLK